MPMNVRVPRFPPMALALAYVALGAGCDCEDAVATDREQIAFDNPYRGTVPRPFASGDAVVEGATFCPTVLGWFDGGECVPISAEPEAWFEPCWDRRTLLGPARFDAEGCLAFTGPGEVYWHLQVRECDPGVEVPPFEDDRLDFDVRAIEGLRASWVWEFETRAALEGTPGPGPAFPPDWTEPLGADIRVVQGAPFVPVLGLFDPQDGAPVASTAGAVRATVAEGTPAVTELGAGLVMLDLAAGDRVQLELGVTAGVAPGPVVIGVGPESVASLELFAAYDAEGAGEGWGLPVGVRAVVRDAQGQLLRAPSVTWTVDGTFADPGDVDPRGDYLFLPVGCTPQDEGSGPRSAEVTASVAGFTDTLALRWHTRACQDPPPDPFVEPFELDLFPGCACQARPGHEGAPAGLIGLGVWVAWRRRRRARLRRGSGRAVTEGARRHRTARHEGAWSRVGRAGGRVHGYDREPTARGPSA